MRTVIIVQARMTSTRLPGKVLKMVLNKPLLEYQIERLRRVKLADDIIIATTTNDTDQPIVVLCSRLGIPVWRGSEHDVLARYYEGASAYGADVVVRITSDCPLIDPLVINRVIESFLINQPVDYVSNVLVRTYPRGMDTEVFSFQVLEEAFYEAKEPADREHVTPFIYRNSDRYRLRDVCYETDQSRHRWTVDTPEDFQLIRRIIEELYPINPNFTLKDVCDLLDQHPDWTLINSHIKQKQLQ